MEQKTFSLNPDQVEALNHFERSIAYWSNTYTQMMIKADQAKATVITIEAARKQLIETVCRDNGLDPKNMTGITFEGGDVVVQYAVPSTDNSES